MYLFFVEISYFVPSHSVNGCKCYQGTKDLFMENQHESSSCSLNEQCKIDIDGVESCDWTNKNIYKKIFNLKSVNCNPRRKCNEIGDLITIYDDKNQELYSVCFTNMSSSPSPPETLARTFYTIHFVNGITQTVNIDGTWKNNCLNVNSDKIYYKSGWQRGHLTPNADFGTKTGREETYHYVNAVPQAPYFNSYRWKMIENAVRRSNLPLKVITGTLGSQGTLDYQINIPHFFYKIVLHEKTRNGIVFVGLNCKSLKELGLSTMEEQLLPAEINYREDCLRNYVCDNKCSQLDWMNNEQRQNIGPYVTCCSIEDFVKFNNKFDKHYRLQDEVIGDELMNYIQGNKNLLKSNF